jgi:kumamolisin
MVGDPNTGITIVDSNQDPAWFGEGGTSLSSPLFAAVTALANQARDQQGLPGVGLVAPLLYSMEYSKFQGVVPITNIAGPVQVDTSVLSGIAGWNDMTGLGSPYVPLFVQALVDSK